jgi:predicted DNA-binding transcriptional regulator AlpA
VNLHVSETLTASAAAAIADILERAAADIRARVGSSGIRLDDLPHRSAHNGQADMDTLLDPPALAALLNIDERTLRRRRNEGAIPEPIMLGRRKPRWRRHEIDAWLAERSES